MRKEESFNRDLGVLFDEAYDFEHNSMVEIINNSSQRYNNFEFYKEGGLKRIFTCRDSHTDRKVAMAMPKNTSDLQKVEAFLKEAKLNAALQHPNIVPVYDLGITDSKPWFTMKYIQGQSLDEVIYELKEGKDNKYINLNDRLDLFLKICEAIAYSHSIGIIHLDLKPANIRISDYGDVLVCDWGLASVDAANCNESLLDYCQLAEYDLGNMTVDGVIKGTAGYMAPEQTGFSKVRKGPHSDIFSLGAILYTLLCYETPFNGSCFKEVIRNTISGNFPDPSEIDSNTPYSLEAVCLKAMSSEKEDRYQNVEELISEIQAYRSGYTTGAENASLLKAFKLFYLRHKILCFISFITFILIITVVVMALNHQNLAKRNAIQLAEKMSLEAEYHKKINKEAAPLFLERAKIAYQAFSFDDALKFANATVELDPSIIEAWDLKAVSHFVKEEYTAAAKAFQKLEFSTLAQLNNKCLKEKPEDAVPFPIDKYLEIVGHLFKTKNFKIFGNMIHYKCYSELSLDERIKFVKQTVAISHQKALKRNKFNFSFNKETRHLDVSNNKWLVNVASFQNFPAKSADFSYTKIPNCIAFRGQNLISLDISYTKIINLQTLQNKNLKKLNISGTGILNFTPIYKLPLEVIDISNTGINSLQFTKNFPKLRRLYIHEGQFTASETKNVHKRIKIIIKKRHSSKL